MKALGPSRLQSADYVRASWRTNVPAEYSFEDATTPEFWTHVANTLKLGDKIEMLAENGTWYAELLVVYIDRGTVKTAVLFKTDLAAEAPVPSLIDGYKVEWSGPHTKWRVVRQKDGEVVHTHEPDKARAAAWLDDHLKALAA